MGPIQQCMVAQCVLAVVRSCVQSHTGDFGGKVVMGSTCASPLHAWAVLLDGMMWTRPCCLLPHRSSDWHSGAAEMLRGAEVAAVPPAADICSSTALHYPAVSGCLCQTRNKVSSQFPGVLAIHGHSQDASCSEQGPGRSFEYSDIQEGLPISFTTNVKSICLSVCPVSLRGCSLIPQIEDLLEFGFTNCVL